MKIKLYILAIVFAAPLLSAPKQGTKNGPVAVESVNSSGLFVGMGVHLISAPSVVRYVNAAMRTEDGADDWGTAVEFFGGLEVPVDASWALKAEYSYLFKSYTIDIAAYSGGLQYSIQAPSIMLQYVYPGKGFFLKGGVGGGVHWGTVTPPKEYGVTTSYTASGPGFRIEAEGQTAFDTHLFAYMSGTIGAEFLGTVVSDAGRELNNGSGTVSLNTVTAGVRFGLMYYF